MYRLTSSFLIMMICSQLGCSTIFNPDKTIAAGLAGYFPDNSELESQQPKSLASIIAEQNDGDRELDSGAIHRIGYGTAQSKPATEQRNASAIKPDSSPASSWEKIERAVAIDRSLDEPGQRQAANPDFQRLTKRQNLAHPKTAKHNSQEVIRIYDPFENSKIPRPVYQPVPPLIQRPVLYDESIVKTPVQSLAETVDATSVEQQSDISWKDSLEATIAHLNGELESLDSQSPEALRLQKCLNILNSVAQDRNFVNLANQLKSLSQSLPSQQFEALQKIISSSGSDQTELVSCLKEATELVAESAELKINNATFCEKVEGFGKFKRYSDEIFEPGEEVLLYCELENFAADISSMRTISIENGLEPAKIYRCEFDAQIEFLNEQNETLFVRSFANINDESTTSRKDFYLFFRFQIPKLAPGIHQLQIRFKDKIGRKNATLDSPIVFRVNQR